MTKFTGCILALDLATTTGFAIGRPGSNKLRFGVTRFGKPGSSRAEAYRLFRQWLDEVNNTHSPELVVYESPAIPMVMQGKTSKETIFKLVGLAENLEEWAYDRVELREASVQQVRAHFIGSNRHQRAEAKAMTMEKCRSLGWAVENPDEADACALWSYQVSCLRPDLAAKMTPLFYGKTGRIVNDW